MRINEVLSAKPSHDVITISPDATVRELIVVLAEHNIGALVVSSDGVGVDGIVSERDVVRRLHDGDGVLDTAISSIMTGEVYACSREDGLNDLMQAMTERRIRHVPVLDDGSLTGIVSIGDVVKARMSELEFERDQLDSYVHSAQS